MGQNIWNVKCVPYPAPVECCTSEVVRVSIFNNLQRPLLVELSGLGDWSRGLVDFGLSVRGATCNVNFRAPVKPVKAATFFQPVEPDWWEPEGQTHYYPDLEPECELYLTSVTDPRLSTECLSISCHSCVFPLPDSCLPPGRATVSGGIQIFKHLSNEQDAIMVPWWGCAQSKCQIVAEWATHDDSGCSGNSPFSFRL